MQQINYDRKWTATHHGKKDQIKIKLIQKQDIFWCNLVPFTKILILALRKKTHSTF